MTLTEKEIAESIKRGDLLEAKMRDQYANMMEDLVDRSCIGCVFVALADATFWLTGDKAKAEEVLSFARQFSDREGYCGTAKFILWEIPRQECDGLAKPWDTHSPRVFFERGCWGR